MRSVIEWLRSQIQNAMAGIRSCQWEALLGLRVHIFFLFIYAFGALTTPGFPDYYDMSELVFLGVMNLGQGINPYGQVYPVGVTHLGEPRFIYPAHGYWYGPFSLIAHLPVLLFPFRFDGAGFADFIPSFVILQVFFVFVIFYRLVRMGHRTIGLLVWANPLVTAFEIGTLFPLVMMLLMLGIEQIENPQWCMLWFSLATATYLITAPFAIFALCYHRSKIKSALRGLAPAATVTAFFFLWSALEGKPLAPFQDMFLVQLSRVYTDWSSVTPLAAAMTMGSIPNVLYNLLGTDPISLWTGGVLSMSGVMIIFTLALMVLFLFRLVLYPNLRNSIIYSVVITGLLIASNPKGGTHYYVLLYLPILFLLLQSGILNQLSTKLKGSNTRTE